MSKRVLTDFSGFTKFELNEDANGKWILEGEFGQADIPTANGRIYPRHLWEREIRKIKPAIDGGTVMGHLNHPKDGKTDLKEVAMVMKDLWLEPNGKVKGKAELCNNQWGDQYKAIHNAGGRVGVSSRGMGSTKMGEGQYRGHEVVDEDYEYMTHDLVADPAVKSSYPDVKEESTAAKVVVKEIVMEKIYTEADLAKKLEEQKTQLMEDSKKEKELAAAAAPVEAPKETSLADTAGKVNVEAEKALETAETADEKALKAKEKKTEDVNDNSVEESKASVAEVEKAMELVKGDVGKLKARGGPIEHSFAHSLKVFKDRGEFDGSLKSAIDCLLRSGYEVKGHELKDESKDIFGTLNLEINNLKAQVESKNKEIAALVAGAKAITESAKRIGLALMYEKEMGAAVLDRADLLEEVGPLNKYTSEEQLDEAMKKGKKKVADKKKAKLEAKKKMEAAEARHRADMKKIEESVAAAKKEAEEAKQKLAESLKTQNALAAKIYLEESIKLNPNAQKIRTICEGMTEKVKIDATIKQFSIDESASSEYNYVQNRLARLEAIRNDPKAQTLVENQLAKESQVESVGGVDAEIAEVVR